MGFLDIFKRKANEVVTEHASSGTIRNSFYSSITRQQGQPSPQNLNTFLELYRKDPVVQAALTTRSEAILNSGWTIEGSKTAKDSAERLLKKIGFNYTFLNQLVLNALLYDHVFIEIERTNAGSPAGLHILETPFMEIVHDEHGEIFAYEQLGENGTRVRFPVEDIVYLKTNGVSSAVWGESSLESLFRTLTTKNLFEKFIHSMAANNDFRQVFKTSMTDDNIREFLAYYADARSNPDEPLVMQVRKTGDSLPMDNVFETMRDPEDLNKFLGVIDKMREQALMVLKVPPILIGVPDNSNRSNSDAQIEAFHMSNRSKRRLIAEAIEELFSKLGLTAEFSWNPIDKRNEKDDVEIAERLINMGAKPEVVEEFLRSTGLELPDGELFYTQEEKMKMQSDMMSDTKKSEDLYPSRQRKSEGEANQKIGTGKDGSTREDQL